MSNISPRHLDLDFEKDLPPLSYIDLFPNSPNFQGEESIRTASTESGYKSSSESNLGNLKIMNSRSSKNNSNQNKNVAVSPSPSPSFASETESFEDNPSVKKRKRKRFCYTCDTEFRRSKDFLSHLRGHVTMPYLNIKKLPDDNIYVKTYLESKNKSAEQPSKCIKLKVKKLAGMLNDENQFKIIEEPTVKIKTERIDDFENSENVTEKQAESEKVGKPTVRVLRPDEIKKSKSPPIESVSQPMRMLENMQIPNNNNKASVISNPISETGSDGYFECPTLDGLDQFVQEGGGENADVLLKKLLNSNQSDLNMNLLEPDQWSDNPIPNEFISLDRLAIFCTVCNATFENEVQLYEHKRVSGHDMPINSSSSLSPHLPNQMPMHRALHPSHPSYHQQRFNFQNQQEMRYSPNNPHASPDMRTNGMMYPPGHPHQQGNDHHLQPGSPYSNSYMYGPQGQQLMNYSSQQHQMMMRRQPPPLYRVPQPQPMRPPNLTHASHPCMPYSNYHESYSMNSEIARAGEFMKTRLQKDPNSITPPITADQIKQSSSPPVIMGTPTQIRPRFLTPPVRQELLRQHVVTQHQGAQTTRPAHPQHSQHSQHPQHPQLAQQRMHPQMAARMVNSQGPPSMIRPPGPGMKMPGIIVPKQPGSSMPPNIQREIPPGPGVRITGVTAPRDFKLVPKPTAPSPKPAESSQLGPAIKKIKLDLKQPRHNTSSPSQQNRSDGLPIIKSVIGNAIKFHNPNSPKSATPPATDRESPIQLNDQITLSMKSGENKKDPKEVANLLATRGIIVTQKGGTKSKESTENSSQNSNTPPITAAKEAVQKLQMNNAVSIISKKKSEEVENTESNSNLPDSNSETSIACNNDKCQEKFSSTEQLNKHINRAHPSKNSNTSMNTSSNPNVLNIRAFKCKVCPALFSSQDGVQDHQWKQHKIMHSSADELGVPVIDLRNELTKKKLAALGITNYIPLCNKTSTHCFGFPIVSVQGATNSNICNLLGLGASSVLSLGPVKPIPKG
ncbi:uncharacterized protein LOC129610042 [Condylostylus longicornis]|uniref:uncharacterized protein LOC129610042 n=1 Tax=Condylostylus longicornis TaxID=2530218 RepID=UPI00244DE168|nr:uncharacterized protein LOC129610042 [Condylostylus longicornis]